MSPIDFTLLTRNRQMTQAENIVEWIFTSTTRIFFLFSSSTNRTSWFKPRHCKMKLRRIFFWCWSEKNCLNETKVIFMFSFIYTRAEQSFFYSVVVFFLLDVEFCYQNNRFDTLDVKLKRWKLRVHFFIK